MTLRRTSQMKSQPHQKSKTRSLYRLRYIRQTPPEVSDEVTVQAEVHKTDDKNYPLDEGATGGADEEEEEDKEDEKEEEGDEEEDDEEWDMIQEQVYSGKIRVKVQAGNHNKQVMQLQPKPYQVGRNFKPIFIVDVTPD